MAKKEKYEDKWVILPPHTNLTEIVYREEKPRLLETGPNPLRVRLIAKKRYERGTDDYVDSYHLILGTRTYADGYRCEAKWTFTDANPVYDIIPIPPVRRDFTSLAVVGSEWEFERDWTFCGYDGTNKMHTIPAGTMIRVAEAKNPMFNFCGWAWQEKGLVVDENPALKMFGTALRKKRVSVLPLREVSGYLKLKAAGKVKTYWRLEHTDGTPLVKKNFADLGKVKASARVRFNTVVNREEDYQNGNYDNLAPYWVEANDWVEQPDIKRGLWAVQYDHATKKEIAREDLTTYIVMAKMKQPLTA